MKEFFEEIIEQLADKKLTKNQILTVKKNACKKYKIKNIPSDIQILLRAPQNKLKKLSSLITKPVRTMSGVSPIALMTAPFKCPHGKCIYCPGGLESDFGDVPQSYTGMEPSTMRGIRNRYDPYLITFNRLEQYIASGHMPEKCEVIIQGGTFPSFPLKYQTEFIYYVYKALNDFGKIFFKKGEIDIEKYRKFFEMPGIFGEEKRVKRIQEKILKLKLKNVKTLAEEQKKNETAKLRCIALCIETRPDYCYEEHINKILKFGGTRIELGVQSLDESILKKIKRGHGLKEIYKATKLAKNSLLKVGYHIMPGLPGSSMKKDVLMFKKLFSDEKLKPDALKIYPTMVMKGTKLYDYWKKKKYIPMTTEKAVKVIVSGKKYVPEYCRIMRVQRDIPKQAISAGVNMTNLRQVIEKKVVCRCIRCREPRNRKVNFEKIVLKRYDFLASESKEIFLSFEDTENDILIGFCRLRLIKESFRKEIKKGDLGIRELHVYGKLTGIGEKGDIQHKGYGKRLILEAEKIAKELGSKQVHIISGIGVREYYYKLGYKVNGVYVSKKIKN